MFRLPSQSQRAPQGAALPELETGRASPSFSGEGHRHRPQEPAGHVPPRHPGNFLLRRGEASRRLPLRRAPGSRDGIWGREHGSCPRHAHPEKASQSRRLSLAEPAKLPRCLPGPCLRNQKRRSSNKRAPVLSQPLCPQSGVAGL